VYELRAVDMEASEMWISAINQERAQARSMVAAQASFEPQSLEQWVAMGRSEEEFHELDKDNSGFIEGNEVPWYLQGLDGLKELYSKIPAVPVSEKEKSKANQPRSRVRESVSKNLVRFRTAGFDLNLVYITPRIIVMGFPATGVEATYRNPIGEVVRFFETFHSGHYKVYNLCPPEERQYPAGRFPNVELFPFEDHCPPCLAQMPEFTRSASAWLSEDPANVVAIHCKAGKGRSGCMTAALLLKEGVCRTPEEALELFDAKRASDKQGVTIPSQRRYAYYYDHVLHMGRLPMQDYALHKVQLATDQFQELFFELQIVNGSFRACYNSRSSIQNECTRESKDGINLTTWVCTNLVVRGDICIKFSSVGKEFYESDRHLFDVWLNLGFVPPDGVVTLPYDDLDIRRADKEANRFNSSLQVGLKFDALSET